MEKTAVYAVSLFCACAPACAGQYRVDRSVEISSVPASFPVRFCLLTAPPRQYAAYYDEQRRMTVASRRLGSKEWEYKVLPSRVGWDSHNYITMALDSGGCLHLAGNMHCVRLIYFRTSKPGDIGTFERIPRMTGRREDRCTYPKFITNLKGELVFNYRDGGSGRGVRIYNIYDVETKKWSRLLDKPLMDGQGRMNAYPMGPEKGPDGLYHVSWVWRDTPDCETNHDLSYARSRDLVRWETIDGKAPALPITLQTRGVIVDPIPAKGGILNGSGQVGFDSKNRPVISYHKFDKKGNTQAYVARFNEGGWYIACVTDWDYRWYFQGRGSIEGRDVYLGRVAVHEKGRLALPYRHKTRGSGLIILDEKTLEAVGTAPRPRRYARELTRVRSKFKGMGVRFARDTGSSGEKGVKYVLRWETLGRNRDRPRRPPLPEPSQLELIRLVEEK